MTEIKNRDEIHDKFIRARRDGAKIAMTKVATLRARSRHALVTSLVHGARSHPRAYVRRRIARSNAGIRALSPRRRGVERLPGAHMRAFLPRPAR